jgi:hypothetical protein
MAHRDTLNKRVLETLREARASAAKLGKLANTLFMAQEFGCFHHHI